jgi:shikimate dehydrogenase
VTLPHKAAAAAAAGWLTATAGRTGTANCFWADDSGRLAADNTDVAGFRLAAEEIPGLHLQDAVVLLVGAGGAARAVALACHTAGARRIDILNRTPRRAHTLVADLGIGERARVLAVPAGDLTYDLVVNATSLGLRADDALPVSFDRVRAGYAMDLVYGTDGTDWTAHARSRGVIACDGMSMLAYQALLSLERWLGADLPRLRLLAAMREAGDRDAG